MKFDTVIIGGGLAGLVTGLKLQTAGKNCAIVSTGQSALHFWSGSFELLGRTIDGVDVESPIDILPSLPSKHPYSVIGVDKTIQYAEKTKDFLKQFGVSLTGSHLKNSYRITPSGDKKPAWLTFSDFETLESKNSKIGNKALIVNILGFLDFNTAFLAESFTKQGIECRVAKINLEEMAELRKNPSEMRAANIARVMDQEKVWRAAAEKVKNLVKDEDVVVLPAVFGLKDKDVIEKVKACIGTKTIFIATMPPSVPGIRTQLALKTAFTTAGGHFFLGDTVNSVEKDKNGQITSVGTVNFGDIRLHADNFVLATGSFFSNGLIATPHKVYEPIFDLDIIAPEGRENWFDRNFWNKQNYMSIGVAFSPKLKGIYKGKEIDNLYVTGGILSGHNPLYERCGGGVTIISAMAVADNILNK